MSEHEFEAYLALLGGMLGLSDEQRDAISGELRDHMLERMDEQMAAGVPRNEVIQQALAEFGDASRLAAGLAAAATLHRRRLIMRWTFGTVATFGLLLFIGLAYWPAGENGPGPQRSDGQQPGEKTADKALPELQGSGDPNERAFLALQQPISVNARLSVERLISEIASKAGVQVEYALPPETSDEITQPLKNEISVQLDRVPALTALKQATKDDLGLALRDGTLLVMAPDDSEMELFTHVYAVSDLLAAQEDAPVQVTSRSDGYAQLRRLVEERSRLLLNAKVNEAAGYDQAIVIAAELLVREAERTRHGAPKLVRVLQDVVEPSGWDLNGGPYSMQSYGNTLVVSASLQGQWELTKTIARLRKHAVPDEGTARRLQHGDQPDQTARSAALVAPSREAAIPPYIIEPPDILSITALKTVPKPPYKLRSFDVVIIRVVGVFEDVGQPIAEAYSIQPDGTVDLGPTYGKVKVVDRSVEEATVAIEEHLRQFVKSPKVAVSLAAASEVENVRGKHLVGPDGRVNLGTYGQVYVAGKTLVEAKAAIEEKLAEKLQDPEVIVDVLAYNSKVYYIIIQGNGAGDNVVRIPITGNETVLDALSNIGGVKRASTKKIWIARPAPSGIGTAQELPVDFQAITKDGSAATNYQILPGDRIFIASKDAHAHEERLPPPRVVPADVPY